MQNGMFKLILTYFCPSILSSEVMPSYYWSSSYVVLLGCCGAIMIVMIDEVTEFDNRKVTQVVTIKL